MSGATDEDAWTITPAGGDAVPIPPGRPLTVGRADAAGLAVADPRLSRTHFTLTPADGALRVRDETGGRNPMFVGGEGVAVERSLTRRATLAAGDTRFTLRPPGSRADGGTPAASGAGLGGTLTFDARTLAAAPPVRPDLRLEALARLPDLLRTTDGEERAGGLSALLLAGVPDADGAGLATRGEAGDADTITLAGWRGRDDLAAPPAVPPVVPEAFAAGKPVLDPGTGPGDGRGWAFCVPVGDGRARDGGAGDGAGGVTRGVLVTGRSGEVRGRAADVRFASLCADTLAAADRTARLQKQAAALRPFLPPRVLAKLGEDPDPAALAPAACTATVLFCDLRGFSRTAEDAAADPAALPALLGRVSAALTVMTARIREHGGVTADFLGDAALAFWGWPDPHPADAAHAAAAALDLAADFAADRPDGDPLAGFRVGVGVATGPAVAGRIGAADQAKITVFGPVANLASRLEGLSKPLGVPVVCDAATAAAVRAARDGSGPPGVRTRPLATVVPAGMDRPCEAHELLPPAEAHPLTDADLARYADAVAVFTAGDWSRAAELLQDHPAADLAQDFLRQHLAAHRRTAPVGWDGAVRVGAK